MAPWNFVIVASSISMAIINTKRNDLIEYLSHLIHSDLLKGRPADGVSVTGTEGIHGICLVAKGLTFKFSELQMGKCHVVCKSFQIPSAKLNCSCLFGKV